MPLGDIIAGIDGENQIRVECEVQGLYKKSTYGAIVDTGFSGSLVLPLIIAVDLGLTKAGATNVTLADGSTRAMPLFMCKAKIGNTVADADTLVMGTDIMIGMGILNKFRLCVAAGSGSVTIENEKAAVRFLQLAETLRRLGGRGA